MLSPLKPPRIGEQKQKQIRKHDINNLCRAKTTARRYRDAKLANKPHRKVTDQMWLTHTTKLRTTNLHIVRLGHWSLIFAIFSTEFGTEGDDTKNRHGSYLRCNRQLEMATPKNPIRKGSEIYWKALRSQHHALRLQLIFDKRISSGHNPLSFQT